MPEHEKRDYKKRRYAPRRPGYKAKELAPKYGLTADEYLLLHSRARCDICASGVPGAQGAWATDHDHDTGVVRGLLCNRCNFQLLPVVERHGHLVEAARQYLANPPGVLGRK